MESLAGFVFLNALNKLEGGGRELFHGRNSDPQGDILRGIERDLGNVPMPALRIRSAA